MEEEGDPLGSLIGWGAGTLHMQEVHLLFYPASHGFPFCRRRWDAMCVAGLLFDDASVSGLQWRGYVG